MRIKLCEVIHLSEGEVQCVEASGLEPLAVYRYSGEIYITSDRCTHSTASLSEGYFEGGVIECPLHRGQFDVRTGEVIKFPCKIPLKTYEPIIEDGWICIDLPLATDD